MATYLFNYFFGARAPPAEVPAFPYKLAENPYRCKRVWPPDFAQLSPKHQFRLERRYKRRTALKWARPTWVKATKLAQWGGILFVGVYGIFWMDMDRTGQTTLQRMTSAYESAGRTLSISGLGQGTAKTMTEEQQQRRKT